MQSRVSRAYSAGCVRPQVCGLRVSRCMKASLRTLFDTNTTDRMRHSRNINSNAITANVTQKKRSGSKKSKDPPMPVVRHAFVAMSSIESSMHRLYPCYILKRMI